MSSQNAASTQGQSSSAPPLPEGFRTIEQIQNMPSCSIRAGEMVSVIGFVKDFQPPVQTRGSDHKCTIEIKDHSIPDTSVGLKIIIFWTLAKMPTVHGASDAVLVRKAKTQMWAGGISLLANVNTEFHILPKDTIPRELLGGAMRPPWQNYPRYGSHSPTAAETSYVVWSYNHIDELYLPSVGEFQARAQQAMNVREKFTLLKDAKPDTFHDILGEVIRIFDGSGMLTVYFSDYTANSLFYNYIWGGGGPVETRDGDEYGYIPSKPKSDKDWPGPFGKMAIQLTIFDGHADFIRDQVKVNQWLLLKNVQFKYGRMGGCLEGVLRGDREAFEGKVQVQIMEPSEEPEGNNARWKEAVRRKREWWKKFEKQKQDILNEAVGLGDKRKRGVEVVKKNAKQRRKELRAAGDKASNSGTKLAEPLDLNENIRCNFPDQPPVPLHVLFKRPKTLLDSNQEAILPFDVCKYRANVRVVDYFPERVEDFSVGRRITEYDMLSDYSGGEETDLEADRRAFKSGKGFAKKYEWRFALQVEDADPTSKKERMWLLVDNPNAQFLLNVDATNLRGDNDTLREVKEQLCILWGNLEENKTAYLKQRAAAVRKPSPPTTQPQSSNPEPFRKAGEQPNVDSDGENDESVPNSRPGEPARKALTELDSNQSTNIGTGVHIPPVSNKAFTCCIKQYGAKVREDDPSKANAGEGKRWKRMFGLFGTRIA